MKYEYGSIEIASQLMLSALAELHLKTSAINFVIVGDAGSGKSTMAE